MNPGYTFRPTLVSMKNKLKVEHGAKDRYNLVAKMIRNADTQGSMDANKLLLFQTVVMGLNLLSGLYTYLKQFSVFAHFSDLEFLNAQLAAGALDAVGAGGLLSALQGLLNTNKNLQLSNTDLTMLSASLGQLYNLVAVGGLPSATAKLRALLNEDTFLVAFSKQLLALTNDMQGLVSVKLDEKQLSIDWSGLKSLIEQLFMADGYFLEASRPHIDDALYEKYTNKLNIGSFYWLQEQLMEKLVNGRDRAPATLNVAGYPNALGYDNLDKCTQIMGRTWQYFGCKIQYRCWRWCH